MGQTKKKRKRKHRGTPAGTIQARGRTGRPPTKADAKQSRAQTAADRRAERLAKPPTWRSALNRSAIAAVLFGLVVVLAFGQDPASGAALAAVMVVIYMPMTYYMDLFLHKRFKRRAEGGR